MNITAVDPGKLSGYVRASGLTVVRQAELSWPDIVTQVIADLPELDLLVVERYTITSATLRKSRQPWSLEIIGALRYHAAIEGVRLAMQAPSDAKRLITDRRLRDLGVYTPTEGGHINDALRHWAYWLATNGRVLLSEAA